METNSGIIKTNELQIHLAKSNTINQGRNKVKGNISQAIKLYSQKGLVLHSYTIVAYSSHFDEEEDMELEWYKEDEEQIQAVVHGHCSMGLATQDRQVGHTRGLQVAAVGHEEVDMEQQK